MSKEMLELAYLLKREFGLDVVTNEQLNRIVAALRACAVAEPMADKLQESSFRAGLKLGWNLAGDEAAFKRAMDAHSWDEIAASGLYAHPAPAAPVPASVREALEKIAKQATSAEMREAIAKECAEFESARSWHASAGLADFEGGYDECVSVARAALASLPAPEAAPTREEIIEQCAKVVGDMRQSEAGLFDAAHSGQRGCDRSDALYDAYRAILALKAAPAK